MGDLSDLVSSEDSKFPETVPESEFPSNFTLVQRPSLPCSEKLLFGQRNWKQEISEALAQIDICQENVEWISTNFYKWETLENAKDSKEFDSITFEATKNALNDIFDCFLHEKKSLAEYLFANGLNDQQVVISSISFNLSQGAESMLSFLESNDAVSQLSAEEIEVLKSFFAAPSEKVEQTYEEKVEEICNEDEKLLGEMILDDRTIKPEQEDLKPVPPISPVISPAPRKTNWKKELESNLLKNKINDDATKWILENFCKWNNLENLKDCQDLSPKKAKFLQTELDEIFTEFLDHKNVFLASLNSFGVSSYSLDDSSLVLHFAGGVESMQSFIESQNIKSHFSQTDVEKISAVYNGNPLPQISEPESSKAEQILKEVENILKELSLDEDGLNEVLDKFSTFDNLEVGLESCEDITPRQRRMIAEKLKDAWSNFRSSGSDANENRELERVFKDLSLPTEAKTWITEWIDKRQGDLHSTSEIDECSCLSQDQIELVKEKVRAFLNSSVKDCEKSSSFRLFPLLNSVLEAMPEMSKTAREWVLHNIVSFESIDDFEKCGDLTGNQIGYLKSAFEDTWPPTKNGKSNNEDGNNNFHQLITDLQGSSKMEASNFEESTLSEVGLQLQNSLTITPLILCRTESEEGFSVDKYSLAEEAVNYICGSVPPEITRDSPVIYQSVSNGTVIDFYTLDKLSISCIGLFGPYEATISYLSRNVLDSEEKKGQIEDYFKNQSCGLFLISVPFSVTKFIVFFSERNEDFVAAKKDSRAVQFLRYMTQLTDNVFICVDDLTADRLLANHVELFVKTDRRSRYKIEKRSTQEESCYILPLGTLKFNRFQFYAVYAAGSKFVLVNYEKIESKEEKTNLIYQDSFDELKHLLKENTLEDVSHICDEFKVEYVKEMFPGEFSAFQDELDKEAAQKMKEKFLQTQKSVMLSVALYFVQTHFRKAYETVIRFLLCNEDENDTLCDKLILFERGKIIEVIDKDDDRNFLRDLFSVEHEDLLSVEKFLTWWYVKNKLPEEKRELPFDQLTFLELNKFALESAGLIFSIKKVDRFLINRQLDKVIQSIDYYNPPTELQTSVAQFICHLLAVIKPYCESDLFLMYCRKRGMVDNTKAKNEQLTKKAVHIFDEAMQPAASTSLQTHPENTKGVILSIQERGVANGAQIFSCSIDKWYSTPAKTFITVTPSGLRKQEKQRLNSSDTQININSFLFHNNSSWTVSISENNILLSIFAIEDSRVILISNLDAEQGRISVFNRNSKDKPLTEIKFGKPISKCSFDSKTKVIATHFDRDLGVLYLNKLTEDYGSQEKLPPVDLLQMFGLGDSADIMNLEFCLQPETNFVWVFFSGKLRKINHKKRAFVGKTISIHEEIVSFKITPDGSCLFVINEDGSALPVMTATGNVLEAIENIGRNLQIFTVGNRMLAVELESTDVAFYQILITGARHETKLSKQKGGESQNSRTEQPEKPDDDAKHWIHSIYWMFTKFPCNDLLANNQHKLELWIDVQSKSVDLKQKVASEINAVLNKLYHTKKPLDCLEIHTDLKQWILSENLKNTTWSLSAFLKKLITFVPIQIARCQANEFNLLDKGKTISLETVKVAFDLTKKINFGFYESIFNSWTGKIKVISSMGKQSSGKSYTLNHLTGSSFNIAGTRCTDGCWMTVKEQEDCLYVILDFEGLGSIERTEQEDMLLSLFNSSISTITIFKTEKRLDREVDKLFNKINLGSDQLKGTEKVFKGKFMIVINDVAEQDVEDTPNEFEEKISNIVHKSENNFIKKLFNGDFEILAFPAFESPEYYEMTSKLLEIIQLDVKPVFDNGREFMNTVKLLMAKLAINDFSPLDRQQIDERVRFLRSYMNFATHFGQMSDIVPKKAELDLKSLDDPEFTIPIQREVQLISGKCITLNDYDTNFEENQLDSLLLKFVSFCKPLPDNVLVWRHDLESYVSQCIQFRFERVRLWLEENLRKWRHEENVEHSDIISAVMENVDSLKLNFEQTYKFCDEKCAQCFLKCTQILNHRTNSDEHGCGTSHKCRAACEYCSELGQNIVCKMPFGHSGKHMCNETNHVCCEPCRFNSLNDCAGECQKMTGHDGWHECSEKRHPCKEICTLDGCQGRCVINCDDDHSVHKCNKEQCISQCSIETCTNKCAALDHFHGMPASGVNKKEQGHVNEFPFVLADGISRFDCDAHFCGKEHQCDQDCEHEGLCRVSTEKQLKDETFQGERDTFTYSLKFMEKGEKLKCRWRIKPFSRAHEGGHSCATEVHFCKTMCPTCENICNKPVNHEKDGDPLHHARHGNMRRCFFIANEDDIQVGSHKYKVGEPAVAEMCHIFCNTMGRGHFHVVECDRNKSIARSCTHNKSTDGRQHQTTTYHPHPNVPKDEMTHDAYWASIGFQDPCNELDVEEFKKCPAYCSAETHGTGKEKVYCEMSLWHDPVRSLTDVSKRSGFLSKDGHVFPCDHPPGVYHFVLCLDGSFSMEFGWHDLVSAVELFVNQRKRQSSLDKISVIVYTSKAHTVAEFESIADFDLNCLRFIGGETDFGVALKKAYILIERYITDQIAPVLIFMSDGQCGNGELEMERIAQKYRVANNLQVYTLGFGDAKFAKLKELARIGHGEYLDAVDALALRNMLIEISAKHPTTISVSY